MAFTPTNKKYQPKKNEEITVKQNSSIDDLQNEEDDYDFLSPRKDVKKDSVNDVYQEETLKKTSYQMTLKTLNALKIVSPIVSAIIQSKTNSSDDDERVTKLFKDMVMQISDSALKACEAIGVDPKKEKNAWVRNIFERTIADFVKIQYLAHGNVDTSKVENIIHKLSDISHTVAEKEPFEDISAESLVSMAIIRAMMPIVNESLNNFDFYRKIEDDLETIINLISKECEKGTEILASDYASEKNRAQLYFILMQEAGVLYASCWKSESKRILQIIENKPSEIVKQNFEKFKKTGGFPLSRIDQDFILFFERFIVISQKLSLAERKANLSGRIKKK